MLQRLSSKLVLPILIASGLIAILRSVWAMMPVKLDRVELMAWQDLPLFVLPPEPDPAAQEIVEQYLEKLSSKGALPQNQGVWIQSGMRRLATHQGKVPLPAASFTKIATTIAALEQWEPSHRFETLVSATGSVKDGILQGDLVITGSGDPFLIWQEAIALGNSLNQLGIRRVSGNLVISGDFYLNYERNPAIAGQLLRQGINAQLWSQVIVAHHRSMPPETPQPQVIIDGSVKVANYPIAKKILLLRHWSLSMTQILREMNIYSNNELAQMLAQAVGGAQIISKLAAQQAGVSPTEIQLINGSGLGVDNRISPRAASAMLMALERFLEPHQLSIMDLFPVAGRDHDGTMLARQIPAGTTVKTGTLREVSALTGVMLTRDRGLVWFAIINGGWDIRNFRLQQDKLLEKLLQKWGTIPDSNNSNNYKPVLLGDPLRNEQIFIP
ncbi:MAG: D-alanyl-D-alanine carboxypeptidase [Symploca sp. SIO2B6]|nr:D-alanyl-D-alanine carboxypeptidase [Symploca sp. SIO2B6]